MGECNTRERVRGSTLATNLVFSRVCEEFDNQIYQLLNFLKYVKYQLEFFYFLSYVFSDQFSSICFIVHILSFLKLFILTFAFLFFHCFSYAAIHITACSNQSCFNNIFCFFIQSYFHPIISIESNCRMRNKI